MKEQTYGWYPSAKNVYDERRIETLTPYQLEALYRYRQSKYYQPPCTPPEQKPPKSARPSSTASRDSRGSGSRAHDGSSQCNIQPRVQSAPIHTMYKPPPRLNLPTPQQCWSTHVPETEITVPPPQQEPPPLSVSAMLPKEPSPPPKPPTPAQEYTVAPSPPPSSAKKISRVQSATVRRKTPTKPQRPVKSAGPTRPTPSPVRFTPPKEHVEEDIHPADSGYPFSWPLPSAINIDDIPPGDGVQFSPDRPPSGRFSATRSQTPLSKRSTPSQRYGSEGRPPSGKRTPLRPQAPSPAKMETRLHEDECLDRGETPDYDEMVKKYGWMMEVHGDPLKLKKVSRRLPYYVTVDEPETERDPPKVHMENIETFFLNTIPRRPMAFAIDKEWISEVIHKKRMEMQKKHGLNYRYKNFSFVY